MLKRPLIAALAVAALAACSPSSEPLTASDSASLSRTVDAALDQPFELKVGQSATLAGEGLTLSFEAVAEDSRCPTGVQCVWEGNAKVLAVASKDGKAAGLELNTALEPRTATYLDYTIELVSLEPHPDAQGGAIPQNRYRATFVVRKTAA